MIGIFDSGVGGFSVLLPLLKRLERISFTYLADTAHLPYSSKTPHELKILVGKILRYFEGENVEGVIFACNTSSALVLPEVRGRYGLPVFGVVDPGISAAVSATRGKGIGVAANAVTAGSGVFGRRISEANREVRVIEQGCPELVPLVEEGNLRSASTALAVEKCCETFQGKIDTLILGCTHFPFLRHFFEKALPGVVMIDPAVPLAEEVVCFLEKNGKNSESPRREIVSTGSPDHIRAWVKSVLNLDLACRGVSIDGLEPWLSPSAEKSKI